MGQTQNDSVVYLSELSSFTLAENGIHESPSGLYLYEECDTPPASGIRVLAQIPDIGAAYRLLDLLKAGIVNPTSCTGREAPASVREHQSG